MSEERLALLPGSEWRKAGLPGLGSADTILLPDSFARAAQWTHAVGWSFYSIARPIFYLYYYYYYYHYQYDVIFITKTTNILTRT